MKRFMKAPQAWLALALAIILLGSFFASLIDTSFYTVKTSKISFETDKGILTGMLYMPKGAGADNPRPTIITTHGYTNTKEMQSGPSVEMSRRGYIVLALDSYSHGDSFLNEVPYATAYFAYFQPSVYDAVKYMYEQPYVLKDDAGNGIIGVSGHSMGGFSSTLAVYYDEQDYQAALGEGKPAVRKIKAALSVGSDYMWTNYSGVDANTAEGSYANRVMGTIAGQYDEFFFDAESEATGKTMVKKNYIGTDWGKLFLHNPENPEVGVFYPTDEDGLRIIYQPNETHGWNPMSTATSADQINFYTRAFQDYGAMKPVNGQIWFLKELFECLAMIGYFMLFIPVVQLLSRVSFLKNAVSEPVSFQGRIEGGKKAISMALLVIGAILPAWYYQSLIGRAPKGMGQIKYAAFILGLLAIVGAIVQLVKGKQKNVIAYLTTAVFAFLTTGLMLVAPKLFVLGATWPLPITNSMIFWVLAVTFILALLMAIGYCTINKPAGMDIRQYGFYTGWKTVLASFLVAVIAAAAGFVVLHIIYAVFHVDFRFWLVVQRAFNRYHLWIALRYMPFFFLFYFVNGILVYVNSKNLKGIGGYVITCIMNVGSLFLWLLIQYGMLFGTGTAAFPTQHIWSIILIGLSGTLLISTVITKKCIEKTNNVYTGAFLNTIVMTVSLVATTTMYYSIAG